MQKILEQRAIDALFAQQDGGAPDPLPAIAAYNFGGAGQISNEQMKAIAAVGDTLARNLTHTMGAWLRAQVHVALAASEQMAYSEFLSCLPEPSYVCLLRLEPMGRIGLLEVNLLLAMTMIDLLLGGKGAMDKLRDVTDIEDAILHSVLEVVMRELNAAWQSVGLRFSLEKREAHSRILRLMPGSERMLCLSLDLQMPGTQGMLNFCLPAVVLNTVHRKLVAMSEQPRRFQASGARVAELVGEARCKAVLRLPAVRLSSRSIGSLAVGDVLELPLPRNTQCELRVDGVRVCGAGAVARGEHRAAMVQAAENSVAGSSHALAVVPARGEQGASVATEEAA